MRKYLFAMTAACVYTGAWAEISFENIDQAAAEVQPQVCLLYTSPSPRDATLSRMPSSA